MAQTLNRQIVVIKILAAAVCDRAGISRIKYGGI
jgi:hypothetical protein